MVFFMVLPFGIKQVIECKRQKMLIDNRAGMDNDTIHHLAEQKKRPKGRLKAEVGVIYCYFAKLLRTEGRDFLRSQDMSPKPSAKHSSTLMTNTRPEITSPIARLI